MSVMNDKMSPWFFFVVYGSPDCGLRRKMWGGFGSHKFRYGGTLAISLMTLAINMSTQLYDISIYRINSFNCGCKKSSLNTYRISKQSKARGPFLEGWRLHFRSSLARWALRLVYMSTPIGNVTLFIIYILLKVYYIYK